MDIFDLGTFSISKLGGFAGFLALIVCIVVLHYINKVSHERKTDMDNATISHIAETGTPKKVFIAGNVAVSLLNILFLYSIANEFKNDYTIIIEGYSISVSALIILMSVTVGMSANNIHMKFASFFFGAMFITQIAVSLIIFSQNTLLASTGLFLTLSAIPLTYMEVLDIKKKKKKSKKKSDINGELELAFMGPQLLWILLFATYLVV